MGVDCRMLDTIPFAFQDPSIPTRKRMSFRRLHCGIEYSGEFVRCEEGVLDASRPIVRSIYILTSACQAPAIPIYSKEKLVSSFTFQ